jgi:hypothetical protein
MTRLIPVTLARGPHGTPWSHEDYFSYQEKVARSCARFRRITFSLENQLAHRTTARALP